MYLPEKYASIAVNLYIKYFTQPRPGFKCFYIKVQCDKNILDHVSKF